MNENNHETISYETITYKVKNQVALITMNRPKVINALNARMRCELLAAINTASSDVKVKVVVLTGAGRGFCVGQDLAEEVSPGEGTRQLLEEQYKPLILAIDQSEKLVVAAVNGPAAGIGAAMALACDLLVMADDAYMYQAFLAIGLIPDGGACWQLVQQLGYRRALALVIEGSKLSADHCLQWGLANRVIPTARLIEETTAWAEQLAQKAPLAVAASKRALKQAQHTDLPNTIIMEAQLQAAMAQTEDAAEGSAAFLEKRQPVFKGR